MGFFANVKADFKSLPRIVMQGSTTKWLVGLHVLAILITLSPIVLFWSTCHGNACTELGGWWAIKGYARYGPTKFYAPADWVMGLISWSLCWVFCLYLALTRRLKRLLIIVLILVSFFLPIWTVWIVPSHSSANTLIVDHVIFLLSLCLLGVFIIGLVIRGWKSTPFHQWDHTFLNKPDHEFYEIAWQEVQNQEIQEGLWAKLWAKHKGDESKTKAAYLKERVRQLRAKEDEIHHEVSVEPSEAVASDENEWDASSVDDLFKQGAEAVGGDPWLKKVRVAKVVGIIISIGVVGYYFLAPDIAPTSRKQSTLSTIPLPASGAVRASNSIGLRPVTLTIQTSGNLNYLVKLAKPNQKTAALDVFVRGGNTEEVLVPVGDYQIRWATGEKWYGYDKLFGAKTSYSQADKLFEFERGWRITVTLYTVSDGNLSRRTISADEF